MKIFWVMKASFLAKFSGKGGISPSKEVILTSGCWVKSARTCPISAKSSLLVSSLNEREMDLSLTTWILISCFSNSYLRFFASQSTIVIVSKNAVSALLSKVNP